jgi:hypothetical protein
MDFLPLLESFVTLVLFFFFGKLTEGQINRWGKRFTQIRFIKPLLPENVDKHLSLIAILTKYTIYIIGIILSIQFLDIQLSKTLVYNFFSYLSNIVIAVFVLFLGLITAQITRKTVELFFSSTGIDELFKGYGEFRPSVLAGLFFEYLVIVIAVILFLSQLGLQTQILVYTTTVVLGIFTFFVAYIFYTSVKGTLPDVTASFILRSGKYLRIGEYLYYEGKKYRVMDIGIIFTTLSSKNEYKFVRNSQLLKGFEKPV